MTILRLLNPQGIAGLALSFALGLLLLIQAGETRHWKKQSGRYEQLYGSTQAALATTVANYRAAADQARAEDKANAERVAAEQHAINERTNHDFETRIAAARAAAERLRLHSEAAADSVPGRNAAVSALSAASGGAAQGSGQNRLPPADALTATEQAIQLDELIEWIRAQAKVDNNAPPVASPPSD